MDGLKGVKKVSEKDREELRAGQVDRVPMGTIRKAKDTSDLLAASYEAILNNEDYSDYEKAAQLMRQASTIHDPEKAAQLFTQYRYSTQEREDNQAITAAEHGLFARQEVHRNILNALPLAVAISGYAAMKAAGYKPEATPPSMAQVGAGYKGLFQGLIEALFDEDVDVSKQSAGERKEDTNE